MVTIKGQIYQQNVKHSSYESEGVTEI